MVGVSSTKNGRKVAYYACSSRASKAGCDQDDVRADEVESLIISEFKELFRDDRFVDLVWQEARRLLAEERPEIESEMTKVGSETARARERLVRYFEAFEAGTMNPDDCRVRIEDLNAQLASLEARRQELETARANLVPPDLDRAALLELLDNFDAVFESGTNPQKKHLLHRLVKEVRVHSRDRAEVWYAFPQPDGPGTPDRTQPQMAPEVGLEPTTLRLTAGCSAIELLRNITLPGSGLELE